MKKMLINQINMTFNSINNNVPCHVYINKDNILNNFISMNCVNFIKNIKR